MKGKDIWRLIVGTMMVLSTIVNFFNADLAATLFACVTLVLAVFGFVYLWRD